MKQMLTGRARRLGDRINTDYIISSTRKKESLDPHELKMWLLEGVDAEQALLRSRHTQVIVEASDQIESKYSRSEEVAETLALYAPQRDHAQQIEEEREKDRKRATYYAGVLAEYLAYAPARDLAGGLVQRLVHLLGDDVPGVRQIVRDALLGVLSHETDPGIVSHLAREMAQAAERLTPRHAERADLVAACQDALRTPASG